MKFDEVLHVFVSAVLLIAYIALIVAIITAS